jgi:hypothetical protein
MFDCDTLLLLCMKGGSTWLDQSPTWVFCCVLQQHGYILTGHAFEVITHVHRASAAAAAAAVSATAACAMAATVLLMKLLHMHLLQRLPLLLQLLLCCIWQLVLAMCLCNAKINIC